MNDGIELNDDENCENVFLKVEISAYYQRDDSSLFPMQRVNVITIN